MKKSPKSARKLPAIYVVVDRLNKPVSECYFDSKADARDAVLYDNDRIVKYLPVPPRARKPKGGA